MSDIDRAVELATFDAFERYSKMPEEQAHTEPAMSCPHCRESVSHPLYPGRYAEGVRLIGQPLTGWHTICAEEREAGRE